jgi:hypothetical protein
MRDLMGKIFGGGDFLKPRETILDFPYGNYLVSYGIKRFL